MKNKLFLSLATLLLTSSLAQADISYLDTCDSFTGSNIVEYASGTLTDAGDYFSLYSDRSSAGAYSYGPGNTPLPTAFGSMTQSIDVYIDPTTAGDSTFRWTLQMGLKSTGSVHNYGRFDFFGYHYKNSSDQWIYSLGKFGDAPVTVSEAGWYTFSTTWIDDGTNFTNICTITDIDKNITTNLGSSTPGYLSQGISSSNGYETGVTWIFNRTGIFTFDNITSTAYGDFTVGLDNISYQWPSPVPAPAAVPAPGALLLAGLGTTFVGKVRRKL